MLDIRLYFCFVLFVFFDQFWYKSNTGSIKLGGKCFLFSGRDNMQLMLTLLTFGRIKNTKLITYQLKSKDDVLLWLKNI